MYTEHVDKLWELLTGPDDTVEMALVLLDSLVDMVPEDERAAFDKIFSGLSVEHGSFAWMYKRPKKYRSNDEQRWKFFWTLLDLYFRLYPEAMERLPKAFPLQYCTKLPEFLQTESPVETLILGTSCSGFRDLGRCSKVSSVFYDVWTWGSPHSPWDKFNLHIDFDKLRTRTQGLSLQGPEFRAEWEMSEEGVCELRILKVMGWRHLKSLRNQLSLLRFPLLESTNVWSDNFGDDLWFRTTPYDRIEFGPFLLHLTPDKTATVAERVEQIFFDYRTATYKPDFHTCVLDLIGSTAQFPHLRIIHIANDVTMGLHITPSLLLRMPVLEHIVVEGGETIALWGKKVWSMVHPLKTVTADEFKTFKHQWSFVEGDGTLETRLRTVSTDFDWVTRNIDFLTYTTHLNIFQSDVAWRFMSQLKNLEVLFVEGGAKDQELYAPTEPFSSKESFAVFQPRSMNVPSHSFTLLQLPYQLDNRLSLSDELLQRFHHMAVTQDLPKYFREWLSQHDYVVVNYNKLFWMDGDIFKIAPYNNIGAHYGSAGKFDLERRLLGQPIEVINLEREYPKLKYNTSRVPLALFANSGVRELWIERECDLRDLAEFKDLEKLYIVYQHRWFKALPEEIGQLTQLRGLYLWGNQHLNALPASIKNLENLTVVNISKNNFTSIPEELFSVPNLDTICLRGCRQFEAFDEIEERYPYILFVDADYNQALRQNIDG